MLAGKQKGDCTLLEATVIWSRLREVSRKSETLIYLFRPKTAAAAILPSDRMAEQQKQRILITEPDDTEGGVGDDDNDEMAADDGCPLMISENSV